MSLTVTDVLSLDDARSRLLSGVSPLGSEHVALRDAAGRVLARELAASRPLPPFDYSAMDGYAVSTPDLEGDGPFVLHVEGEASAGRTPPELESGRACRIFTGAALPPRADAVVMQEHVTRDGDTIRFAARPKIGQHVRRAGEDLRTGAVALAAGTRLSAGALALAAMLDQGEIRVTRRPVVTILCTGDELRAPGGPSDNATSIPESNSVALAALARQAGANVRLTAIVRDEPALLLQAIHDGLEGTDVLVTVGGVSVGDHDHVRPALEKAGAVLDFWKVAIKPGKPIAVGSSGSARVLGLPGNPASALVTFALFGMPLLRALQGDAHPLPFPLRLPLSARRAVSPERLELWRASLSMANEWLTVVVHENQASGAATSLANSDGLAFSAPGATHLEAGELVRFVRWNDF
jgi:molybdopterin molybdotransferase